MRPERPLEPVDLLRWDQAIALAQISRGLALEALRQATPLGFDGDHLWAACPEPALRGEIARANASKFCAQAFEMPRLQIQWARPLESDPQGLDWNHREKALLHERSRQAHAHFLAEPLARSLAQSGAVLPQQGFEPGV